MVTEKDLEEYNQWLMDVWNPNQLRIPFASDAPSAFLRYRNDIRSKWLNDAIEKLSIYGKVKTCKIIEEKFVSIVLTDGFSNEWGESFKFAVKCKEIFPDYQEVETCILEENLAVVILAK